MAGEWASTDYQPTEAEIASFVCDFREDERRGHGIVTLIPWMEEVLLNVPGYRFHSRKVLDDGRIEYVWESA